MYKIYAPPVLLLNVGTRRCILHTGGYSMHARISMAMRSNVPKNKSETMSRKLTELSLKVREAEAGPANLVTLLRPLRVALLTEGGTNNRIPT